MPSPVTTMKVSVIVPSYNQARYLSATLDSVFSQTDADVELIVKDGGSDDGSIEVLRARTESFQWTSQQDGGQTDAINQGLRESTGEIVAYLNSDDIYLPGALAIVTEYFRRHPRCEILYGDAHHLHADGSYMETYPTERWDYPRLLKVCYLCQPAVFWRRSVMEKFGVFDERLSFAMDYEYWLRVGAKVSFSRLKGQFLAGSRLHQETKTLGQRIKVHREIVQVVQRYGSSPEPILHWLKHLASITATEKGHPSSPHPAEHIRHVQLYLGSLLAYAEELKIPLEGPFLQEMELLLNDAERGAQ
jgi:glycosyltransferase involved in cell wall biosynthesis